MAPEATFRIPAYSVFSIQFEVLGKEDGQIQLWAGEVTTLEQEVDLLSALGIWEVDELEMQKEKVSNTNKQLLYLKKTAATSH